MTSQIIPEVFFKFSITDATDIQKFEVSFPAMLQPAFNDILLTRTGRLEHLIICPKSSINISIYKNLIQVVYRDPKPINNKFLVTISAASRRIYIRRISHISRIRLIGVRLYGKDAHNSQRFFSPEKFC